MILDCIYKKKVVINNKILLGYGCVEKKLPKKRT